MSVAVVNKFSNNQNKALPLHLLPYSHPMPLAKTKVLAYSEDWAQVEQLEYFLGVKLLEEEDLLKLEDSSNNQVDLYLHQLNSRKLKLQR